MEVLSQAQLDHFQQKGYLKIPELLDPEIALKLQQEIWEEYEALFDIRKSDPSTWKTPPHAPKKAKISPTNKELINAHFRAIIDNLIGPDNWSEPQSWGGFLVTFPENKPTTWHLRKKIWHWDFELFRPADQKGLLVFSFYSQVLAQGGGTLIVSGSHQALARFYAAQLSVMKDMKHGDQRKYVMKTHPYFKKLTDRSLNDQEDIDWFMKQETVIDEIPLQVIELTGNPGDVVFCHPRLIHAPAGINVKDNPRIMRIKFLW